MLIVGLVAIVAWVVHANDVRTLVLGMIAFGVVAIGGGCLVLARPEPQHIRKNVIAYTIAAAGGTALMVAFFFTHVGLLMSLAFICFTAYVAWFLKHLGFRAAQVKQRPH